MEMTMHTKTVAVFGFIATAVICAAMIMAAASLPLPF
jgi:hypothetical protein